MRPTVFLSYSSKDEDLARRIALDLRMSGIKVWFDKWKIEVGHGVSREINEGLKVSALIVVLLSKASVDSAFVEQEWQSRVVTEATNRQIHILPVLVDDCERPPLLVDKRYADLRSDYSAGMRELIRAIYTHTSAEPLVGDGARIESGEVVPDSVTPPLPLIDQIITAITHGVLRRTSTGLEVEIEVLSPLKAAYEFNKLAGLNRLTLASSDDFISRDASRLTHFDGVRDFCIPRGTSLEIIPGHPIVLSDDLRGVTSLKVDVVADGLVVSGAFAQEIRYVSAPPNLRSPDFTVRGQLKVRVTFD